MDSITRQHRSWNMSRIKCRDTKPELIVRSVLHNNGYRFRLHRKDLPGKPDIVLPKYNKIIMVHGCFWHRHTNCKLSYTPKTRVEFWKNKFKSNIQRDIEVEKALRELGWEVYVVWECETRSIDLLKNKLIEIFNS